MHAPDVVVYCDGITEPVNPGGFGAWGWVALRGSAVVQRGRGSLGWGCTNNVAEYTAAIEAVRTANAAFPHARKELRTDSQLVARQASGEYEVRSARLRPLYEALVFRTLTEKWTVRWVPREENALADAESRIAVWVALEKWPERGRLVTGPAARASAMRAGWMAPGQRVLDEAGGSGHG